MEFENLIKLIETVSASELTGFQYEEKSMKIKLSKETPGAGAIVNAADTKAQSVQGTPAIQTKEAQSESITETVKTNSQPEGKLVLSPLVGTFYTSPAEDADAFVAVGDTVKKGQTLAIVEAMKLMNEIESEFDGVVEEVLVENGQPVEYNQPLFRLK